MKFTFPIALVGLIVTLTSVFLIGTRLEARWAGGEGKIEPCPVQLIGTEILIHRGELMSTGADNYAKYQLCDGTILYLDTNTQIRLSQYKNPLASQNTELELIRGRVIIDGLADVRARNAIVAVGGAGCELVHYSWLDELAVTPLAKQACTIATTDGQEEPGYAIIPFLQTTKYGTFNARFISSSPFDPTQSSAASFYTWTGLQLEALR